MKKISSGPKAGVVQFKVRVPPHRNVCVPGRQHKDGNSIVFNILYIANNTTSNGMSGVVDHLLKSHLAMRKWAN
jgi:hypothetical protein